MMTAQGGALWAGVDEAAEEHGLAVVGGTVNTTGVGGLTLGIGYGYFFENEDACPQRCTGQWHF